MFRAFEDCERCKDLIISYLRFSVRSPFSARTFFALRRDFGKVSSNFVSLQRRSCEKFSVGPTMTTTMAHVWRKRTSKACLKDPKRTLVVTWNQLDRL